MVPVTLEKVGEVFVPLSCCKHVGDDEDQVNSCEKNPENFNLTGACVCTNQRPSFNNMVCPRGGLGLQG
jgi:hypothetical protein